jgi:hypothetical protein
MRHVAAGHATRRLALGGGPTIPKFAGVRMMVGPAVRPSVTYVIRCSKR